MRLPGYFHNEADGHAGVPVGAAESVHHKQPLTAQLLHSQVFHLCPDVFAHDMVIVGILGCCPPNRVFRIFIHDNVFVLGGTARVNTRHDIHRVQFCKLTLFIPFQTRLHFLFVQEFVRRIVDNLRCAGDTILFQI